MALDTFEQRYGQFRSELHPREQNWFDELVCRARRHSNAINRRPHMDFERPVMLAMMLEGMIELDAVRTELSETRKQLDEVCHALAEARLVMRRVSQLTPEELGRLGQVRLDEVAVSDGIPA